MNFKKKKLWKFLKTFTDYIFHTKELSDLFSLNYNNCQRASRVKMRGWRGGSIIELYEDSIQVIQISSVL